MTAGFKNAVSAKAELFHCVIRCNTSVELEKYSQEDSQNSAAQIMLVLRVQAQFDLICFNRKNEHGFSLWLFKWQPPKLNS